MDTETIELTDPETGDEYQYTVERWIECEHCGNIWQSASDLPRPSCSRCNKRTDRNYAHRYTFFSKMTCWLQERLGAEDLYEQLDAMVDGDTSEIEWELYFDQYGKLLASIVGSDQGFPVRPSASRMMIDSDRLKDDAPQDPNIILDALKSSREVGLPTLDRRALTPIEDTDPDSDNWPTRPPMSVEPYAESMRDHARRLEVLVENGWELVDSNGEHLHFEKRGDWDESNPHEITDELE